jgi:hypothetical protein
MKKIIIKEILIEFEGKEYTALPATGEQLNENREKMKRDGINADECNCGEEWCDGEWLWRCFETSEGCRWFITYIVCK